MGSKFKFVQFYGLYVLVMRCVHLRTSSSKTQMLLLEKNISHRY